MPKKGSTYSFVNFENAVPSPYIYMILRVKILIVKRYVDFVMQNCIMKTTKMK